MVPVAVVAVGGGVAAYGLANDDGDRAVTAPEGLELDELEPALLTEGEIGAGFTAFTNTDEDARLTPDELETSEQCREVFVTFQEWGADDLRIEVADGKAAVAHSLALVDRGDPSMGETRAAIGGCGTIAWDDGQSHGEMWLSATDIDGPGDEAFEVALTVDVAPSSIAPDEDYAIFSMRDGVVSIVAGAGAADRDLVRTLSERADEKVRHVLEDQGIAV